MSETIDQLRAELEKCQADCEAMRKTLLRLKLTTHRESPCDEYVSHMDCDVCKSIEEALSADAGKSLLDRLHKLEAQSQEDKRLIEILNKRWLAMSDKYDKLETALKFCLLNNHRDNDSGRRSCSGHECPVCDAVKALGIGGGK